MAKFITGFTDAEGCFHVSIVENKKLSTGKSVRVIFQITLHEKDKALLELIKNYFKVGKVIDRKDKSFYYRVATVEELMIIIKHFDQYPLHTQKKIDYIYFKQIINLIINKQHLTLSGLQKIENIKSAMNFGPSKSTSSNTIVISKKEVIKDNPVLDFSWVSGFVAGEGCFFVNIYKKKESTTGFGVKLVFKITQDKRNSEVLESFVQLFGCGSIYKQSPTSNVQDFIVTKFSDITEKIIPIFEAYPLMGVKNKDFLDFKKVVELMKSKAHLTPEGLDKIRNIKLKMNSQRNE